LGGAVTSALNLDSKPKLAPKTKLRLDPKTSRYILLYPEKGLLLNPTGAAILQRCTGEYTVSAIILSLSIAFNSDAELLEVEVLQFLRGLFDRGLIQAEP
jgi:pyrroloquinoline quinone biosynthesis protein D